MYKEDKERLVNDLLDLSLDLEDKAIQSKDDKEFEHYIKKSQTILNAMEIIKNE